MPLVDIGKLNKRITFLKAGDTTDDMGQSKVRWTEHVTVWATVKPYKSTEYRFVNKLKPSVTHRVYVRFRYDITSDMRIKYSERIYEISGPPLDVDERHELLEIQCEEVFDNAKYQI